MSRESCIIVIDQIALDGFELSAEEQDALREHLTRELERRFSEDWTGDLTSRREGEMKTLPVEAEARPQPAAIATHVASKIVEGLRG